MSDYSNTWGGAAKDAADATANAADLDVEFDAIATASGTKANKTGAPATTNNLAMLTSSGDLADSLVESDGAGNITANVTGNCTGSSGSCTGNSVTATTATTAANLSGSNFTGDVSNTANAMSVDSVQANAIVTASITDDNVTADKIADNLIGSNKINNAISAAVGSTAVSSNGTVSITTQGLLLVSVNGGSLGANLNVELLVAGSWCIVTGSSSSTSSATCVFSTGSNVRVDETNGAGNSVYAVDKITDT